MKIVGMTDGTNRLLVLTANSPRQRALLLCRSITMLGEYYLLNGIPVDEIGNEIPADTVHRAVLTSDSDSPWREFPVPPPGELLSLG